MNLRSSAQSPTLVSATDDVEKTLHDQKNNKKYYTTATGEIFNSDKPSGPFSQPSVVEKVRETTEFCGSFSSRAELWPMVVTEFSNFDSFALKWAKVQGIEDILNKVVDLGIIATDSCEKRGVFRFIKMSWTDMVHHWLMDKRICNNCFDRWIQ